MSADDLDHILWIDLETTGTDENEDEDDILEVGVILTEGFNLTVLEERAYVVHSDLAVGVIAGEGAIPPIDPFVVDMHHKNGLWKDSDEQGRPVKEVEQLLIEMLDLHGVGSKVALGGSGVGHFDRRFIAAKMPRLAERLTFWPLDVGVLRRFFRHCHAGDGWPSQEAKTHRALDDIQLHLREYRFARETMLDLLDLEMFDD